MRRDVRLTDSQMEIVRFCAIECELQTSGERSVNWMIQAWMYALGRGAFPTKDDVLALGASVEPGKNIRGYRRVGVRVGRDVKLEWPLVPRQMADLIGDVGELTPEAWFRQYEEVHPFVDGNGRTGQILYNWLNGTLAAPVWAPNFWNDDRRLPGDGAPLFWRRPGAGPAKWKA